MTAGTPPMPTDPPVVGTEPAEQQPTTAEAPVPPQPDGTAPAADGAAHPADGAAPPADDLSAGPDPWRRLRGFQGGLVLGAVAVAAVAGVTVAVTSGGSQPKHPHAARHSAAPGVPSASPLPTPPGMPTANPGGSAAPTGPAQTTAVTCPAATVTVHTAADLTSALAAAGPGTVIDLADGNYSGQFTLTAVGTATRPVFVCGGRGAVLDGGDTSKGYVLHVSNSAYVRLVGFTAQDGQKGVVLDNTQESVVQGLLVQQTGDEGIHLRERSSDNLVIGNTVGHTGLLRAKFGEGVYLGSAQSNWCTYTDCQPDTSNFNVVQGNVFTDTTAENIDVKEGTTGGKILDNTFDGSGLQADAATGWVNVKGNGYLIEGNTGRDSDKDGFQTHQILPGWGTDNTFADNTAIVNGPGFGFHLTPVLGNKVACSNKEQGAAKGLSNIPCS